jgi:hypothetical protein
MTETKVTYEESNRQWYEAIGEFVVKFEHMCQAARSVILADLNADNTQLSTAKALSLMAGFGAYQLGESIRMLLSRTGRIEPADEATLKDYVEICKRRNTIVHSAWFIGWGSDPAGPDDPYNVTAVGPSRKAMDESGWARRDLNLQGVRAATAEVVRVQFAIAQLLRHTPPFQGAAAASKP